MKHQFPADYHIFEDAAPWSLTRLLRQVKVEAEPGWSEPQNGPSSWIIYKYSYIILYIYIYIYMYTRMYIYIYTYTLECTYIF